MYLATQLLLDYVYHTQKRDLSHLETAITYAAVDFMKMDYYAKKKFRINRKY